MITSHHSFSTRIFLNEVPGTAARPGPPVPAENQENLREFWWFLRGSRVNPPANNRDSQRAVTAKKKETRHA